MYKENPKTEGSGIACCIPQTGTCPGRCDDCFFQSGRSYLEPLADNLPNMPDGRFEDMIIRVNDGNDSNNRCNNVVSATNCYRRRFFNTSVLPLHFPDPVVLTVNPGDDIWIDIKYPPLNLMFVRVRVTTWNLPLVHEIVDWYTSRAVPVVLTFMAFHQIDKIPEDYRGDYSLRKRTLNEYYAITNKSWCWIMESYTNNPLIHSCGTEDVRGGSLCKNCGNCLREYHATMVRIGMDFTL